MAAPLVAIRRAAAAAAGGMLLVALSLEGFQAPGTSSRTRILLDEAHHNLFAAAASGYRSFVRLVTEEGFSVATCSSRVLLV